MKSFATLIILIFCISRLGCFNPERDNPFDPNSPQYTGKITLQGKVLSLYEPYQPIAGVAVSLIPKSLSTVTDASGHFQFENIPENDYRLIAQRKGYQSDTLQTKVVLWEENRVEFHLDALPIFENCQITSQRISRWWPPDDLYLLNIQTLVTDQDGQNDIRFVSFSIPDHSWQDTLNITDQVNQYDLTVNAQNLPVEILEDLIGVPMQLQARDKPGHQSESEELYLYRVIQSLPLPQSPKGLTDTEAQPVLKWDPADLEFRFGYTVDIFRDDSGIITRVWHQENISSQLDSIKVGQNLSTGIYFWTVSVVDELGNMGRSKEASFRVR